MDQKQQSLPMMHYLLALTSTEGPRSEIPTIHHFRNRMQLVSYVINQITFSSFLFLSVMKDINCTFSQLKMVRTSGTKI